MLISPCSTRSILKWQVSPCEQVEFVRASMGVCGLPQHFHDVWSVGLILQGSCSFNANGQSHLAPMGSLFILPPYEVHACGAASADVVYAVLYVEDAVMQDAASCLGAQVMRQAQRVWQGLAQPDHSPEAASSRQAIFDAAVQVDSVAVALDWLARLDNVLAAPSSFTLGPRQPQLHPLQRWFHAHWSQHLDLAQTERAMPRSRSQVIRSFRNATGLTPGAYLRQLRVQKSRHWIGRMPLADVAQQFGFADQAHFSREFKRVFGMAPGRFGRVVSVNRRLARPVLQPK
ncbi:MAG: AraC family transcriptional regulator [Rhodoferax sp.]|uniref:helix-turn-helix domain-containing protein n=1 Tax=Rhodoferax sp. TaxID=50421 RepID=UPI002627CD91|nr:AraC family transcriptional regulator [Rhodoferax sp.]MDD2879438.1 AraC family transcriptional regulator [Rhodoferax sp.]